MNSYLKFLRLIFFSALSTFNYIWNIVVTAGQIGHMTCVYGIFAVLVGFKLHIYLATITAGLLKSSWTFCTLFLTAPSSGLRDNNRGNTKGKKPNQDYSGMFEYTPRTHLKQDYGKIDYSYFISEADSLENVEENVSLCYSHKYSCRCKLTWLCGCSHFWCLDKARGV